MRLNQITVSVKDIERSIAFYRTLGLRLIVKSPHYARFEAPRGEATFSIHHTDGAIPREDAPCVYFEVRDVDFEVRRLKHAGVAIEEETRMQEWLWTEAWLRDPDGNRLCLFHAGENRRDPPWRLPAEPSPRDLHLVFHEDERCTVVRLAPQPEAWRALQDRYGDYVSSLGPFDLPDLLAVLESEWPDLFFAFEEAIRAFGAGDATAVELSQP